MLWDGEARVRAGVSRCGRRTFARKREFVGQSSTQNSDLVADAYAAIATLERGTRLLTIGHEPPERYLGFGGRCFQSRYRFPVAWVLEGLDAAEAVRQIVVADPDEVEPRRAQDRLGVVDAARRFDERDGEARGVASRHLRPRCARRVP